MPVDIKYPVIRKPLDSYRKHYIETIAGLIANDDITTSIRGFFQSFVYLTLNDRFHSDITNIRLENDIPTNGFADEEYVSWRNQDGFSKLHDVLKNYVSHMNCPEVYRPFIVKRLTDYALFVKPNDIWLLTIQEKASTYQRIVGGFDVPYPTFGKENTEDFDKVFWLVYVYPFDNITQVTQSLQHYYVWLMDYFIKDEFDEEYFRICNRNVIDGWKKQVKKPVVLTISEDEPLNRVILQFQSYINTPTKDIMRVFDKWKNDIFNLQKKLKVGENDNNAREFEIKIRHYILYLEGYSAPIINANLYNNGVLGETSYSGKSDLIRSHYKEVKKKVSLAYNKPLSL